jgi:probable phosphoglycerate mutase
LGEVLWGRSAHVVLNEEGKAQAQRTAERFSRTAERFNGVRLDAVYSSPLERALETAEAIARVARLEVKQNAAFNEVDFGDWTGKSFEELEHDQRWRRFNTQRGVAKIPNGVRGGELFLDVQARVVAELNRLTELHSEQNVAIVSHADVIKAAVGYVAGTPIDLLQRFEISPGSVSIIATDEHYTDEHDTNLNDTKLLAVNSRCELL